MTLQLVEAARILQLDPAQGWPQTITPERLGALQAWRKGLDTKTLRIDARTWSKAIELALVDGGIEHTTTTERVQVVELQDHDLFAPIPLASDEWLDRDFGRNSGRTTQATHKTLIHHHITAPAFAAWLAAQGEEPSPHIAAWFKATGVAPAAAPPPPAPVPAPTARRPRNDLLAPLIVKAQGQSTDPTATAAVFAILRSWAEHKPAMPPLVGVTEDGRIQWRDSSDRPQELTLQALGKRLKRRA